MAEGYEIDDPRFLAAEAPYTFFLPTEAGLAALAPGDMAKLIIRSVPPSDEWDAERLWVLIEGIEGDRLYGSLQNEPLNIGSLHFGDRIAFRRWQIAAIFWNEARPDEPDGAHPREYWERCMVDSCVVQRSCPVDYLYRERPDLAGPEDVHPDSGWRIRGTDEGIAEDEGQGRGPLYVALGAVLNADDSWLHLIDAPVGSAFVRDPGTGLFVACSRSAEV